MSEDLLIALWRAPRVGLESCRSRLLDEWAPEAMELEPGATITVSLALDDQGPYTHEPDANGLTPNVDALITMGLERAHDLDDMPARDVLHRFARRVEAWRVDVRRPLVWDRTWPDGEAAPGLKIVSFMRRADGLTRQQFVRYWTENHAPLALRHHVGLWNYTQNVVRRAYTPGGGQIDGIAELQFRTRDDFEQRFFGSDEGRAAIMQDVKKFMAKPGRETALMTEIPLRS